MFFVPRAADGVTVPPPSLLIPAPGSIVLEPLERSSSCPATAPASASPRSLDPGALVPSAFEFTMMGHVSDGGLPPDPVGDRGAGRGVQVPATAEAQDGLG